MLLPVPLPVEPLVLLPVVPGWPPVVGVASVLPLLVPAVVLLVLVVLELVVLELVVLELVLLVPVPVVVLMLLVPLSELVLLVLLSELVLLVLLLVSLPPDDVSPDGRHRSMAWQVSPSPRQVSPGEHAPPWTFCGSGKQSRTRMHALVAWQVVPAGHSSSLVQTSA
ncbi:hypothetical protein [Nannocystis pusilla]|uniref:hypothetical protein n=1 Tax=Nannocystis pusilla TaxID=889268 RepID=UPI003DA6BCA5